MKEKEILKDDIAMMEKSIQYHTARLETFGKPNPKGPLHVLPYDNLDPKHILPVLQKLLKEMKAKLKTKKTKV
jgi:transposase-like protein